MAGEWIKVRTNLWDDPRINQLCELTDQSEAAVIGGLYWLWATADEHSSDGLLHGMTTRTIDRKTGVTGLGKALVTIGWLTEEEAGFRVVRFEEHNGSSAKNRAETARRVANHRSKKEAEPEEGGTKESKSLPRPIRAQILERDNVTCVYCDRKEGQVAPNEVATDGYMHIDHVIPASRGGSDDPSNLVCACAVCNRFKGNRTPEECGLRWPTDVTGAKRGSNAKHVTTALPREDKNKEEPPIPPKGGSVAPRSKAETVTLQTFIENCKAKGERPIRDYAPLWEYADSAGLPKDFVALAWVEFCRRFLPEGTAKAKRYTDWRRAFRKYVESGYLRLWAIDANGVYFLTSQGKQAQKVHESKEAA